MYNHLAKILPAAIIIIVGWVMVDALMTTRNEWRQWPARLARFLAAIIAGMLIFALIYIIGGIIVSTLGYTYYDQPLLRLAHLVCILGAYPAGMAAAFIFRTRHASLILGMLLVIVVHLFDQSSYLGRMVFDDPAIPLNGDFSLTNMALMLVTTLIGGEVGLKHGLRAVIKNPPKTAFPSDTPEKAALTSDGG